MKKIETIWHHLLYTAMTDKQYRHTQSALARHFGYSLSTVHHSLRIPAELGAVRKEHKFFVLRDARKLLFYWASFRNLSRDVLYATRLNMPPREIEGLALPNSIYAAYTSAKKILGEPPADYDKVYFYIRPDDLALFRKRFPVNTSGLPNVFALKMPAVLTAYGAHTTSILTFVDIWNLPDWYTKDFTAALEEKMHGLLS